MKTVDELIAALEPYRGFDLKTVVHMEATEEEMRKRTYKYPYDNHEAKISIEDVGYSDNVVMLGVEIEEE